MNVTFGEAIALFFKNYATFRGRSTRAEYWWWQLFAFLVGIVLSFMMKFEPALIILSIIFSLGVFIPGLALTVRRLHDIGLSGWVLLLYYVPYILMIGYMVNIFLPAIQLILGSDVSGFQQSILSHMGGILTCSALMVVISIIFLIMMCLPSKPDNKYGPNPYGEE